MHKNHEQKTATYSTLRLQGNKLELGLKTVQSGRLIRCQCIAEGDAMLVMALVFKIG